MPLTQWHYLLMIAKLHPTDFFFNHLMIIVNLAFMVILSPLVRSKLPLYWMLWTALYKTNQNKSKEQKEKDQCIEEDSMASSEILKGRYNIHLNLNASLFSEIFYMHWFQTENHLSLWKCCKHCEVPEWMQCHQPLPLHFFSHIQTVLTDTKTLEVNWMNHKT